MSSIGLHNVLFRFKDLIEVKVVNVCNLEILKFLLTFNLNLGVFKRMFIGLLCQFDVDNHSVKC